MSEHTEQCALFEWAAWNIAKCYDLMYLYAIPNGGLRHPSVGKKLKAEGVKAGYPDIGLDVARGAYHGLRIEMKVKGGRVQPEQRGWITRLEKQGYRVDVCWGWEAAAHAILDYLGFDDHALFGLTAACAAAREGNK
jgi:hypothetical protein